MNRCLLPLCRGFWAVLVFVTAAGTSNADLVGYWDFDDPNDAAITVDATSNREGSIEAPAAFTADADGHSGQAGDYAIDFGDSGGDGVVRTDGTFLSDVEDTVTFSFWQQLDEISNSFAFWGNAPSANGGGRGAQAHVPWSNGIMYFDTAGCCASEQRLQVAVDGLDFTEWNHFAFVKNGEAKEIWVNGVLEATADGQTALPTDFDELLIGNAATLGANPSGRIDEFAVFDEALSADLIGRLAAGESASSVPEPSGIALLLLGMLAALRVRAVRH